MYIYQRIRNIDAGWSIILPAVGYALTLAYLYSGMPLPRFNTIPPAEWTVVVGVMSILALVACVSVMVAEESGKLYHDVFEEWMQDNHPHLSTGLNKLGYYADEETAKLFSAFYAGRTYVYENTKSRKKDEYSPLHV